MFYYYGGKAGRARAYPPPRCRTIVEPFAGSAGYSMYHLANVDRVVLVEANERVVDVWRRLLAMTPAEVLALQIPAVGTTTSDPLMMMASASNAVAGCQQMTVTDRMPQAIVQMLRRVARLLPAAAQKVEILHGDYTEAPELEATWFVDPPYQVQEGTIRGAGYGAHSAAGIDFAALGAWTKDREGQVIACEAIGATWLPFVPLYGMTDTVAAGRRLEVMWTNEPDRLF